MHMSVYSPILKHGSHLDPLVFREVDDNTIQDNDSASTYVLLLHQVYIRSSGGSSSGDTDDKLQPVL